MTTIDGMPVTPAPRTCLDVARERGFEVGVVVTDAALHAKMTTKPELLRELARMRSWPGARVASRVVSFADERTESPGESRTRVAIACEGLPDPEPQVWISDEWGKVVARVDFLFEEERTIVEFDGKIKYRIGDHADRMTASDALWNEKLRQDALQRLGYEIVRVTWADLADPRRLAAKIRAAFARSRRRVAG